MGEEWKGGRWPERRQSVSFFPDSIRALWVIASRTDVSLGSLHVREGRVGLGKEEKRVSAQLESVNLTLASRFV